VKTGTLVLPIQDNEGRAVDAAHATVREWLLDLFGGFTEHASTGVWRNARGEIQREPGVFYTFSGDAIPDAFERVVRYVGAQARQDAVYWSWDGVAHITTIDLGRARTP